MPLVTVPWVLRIASSWLVSRSSGWETPEGTGGVNGVLESRSAICTVFAIAIGSPCPAICRYMTRGLSKRRWFMKTIVESLSDPFWQVGGGILAACAIIFVLTVRSPEVRLSREKQGGLRTFVSCDSTHIDVQGAIGFLLMQTSDSSGNSDGTARL